MENFTSLPSGTASETRHTVPTNESKIIHSIRLDTRFFSQRTIAPSSSFCCFLERSVVKKTHSHMKRSRTLVTRSVHFGEGSQSFGSLRLRTCDVPFSSNASILRSSGLSFKTLNPVTTSSLTANRVSGFRRLHTLRTPAKRQGRMARNEESSKGGAANPSPAPKQESTTKPESEPSKASAEGAASEGSSATQSTTADAAAQSHPPRAKPQPPPPEKTTRLFGWKSFGILLVVGGTLLYFFEDERRKRLDRAPTTEQIGVPQLGGPFCLIDHEGRPVTEQKWKDQYKLIYFGFTNCPDICPAEMARMTNALKLLEKRGIGDKFAPLFISVDPFRDTVERVRAYIKDFHPRMVGLTGTPQQVTACSRAFRVYNASSQHNENDTDYLVDHSIYIYMMDKENKLLAFYNREIDAPRLAEAIERDVAIHEQGEAPQTFTDRVKSYFFGDPK